MEVFSPVSLTENCSFYSKALQSRGAQEVTALTPFCWETLRSISMETKESEDLAKPQRKSVSGSWKTDAELVTARPESLSESEATPCDEQYVHDKEGPSYIRIQRNSIFNRAVRHRSRAKARGDSEQTATRPAGQPRGQQAQLGLHIQVELLGLRGSCSKKG